MIPNAKPNRPRAAPPASAPSAPSTPPAPAFVDIGRLRLHLPASYGPRAQTLARLIGEALAAQPWSRSLSCEQLELRDLRLPASADDHELAATISAAIFERMNGGDHG